MIESGPPASTASAPKTIDAARSPKVMKWRAGRRIGCPFWRLPWSFMRATMLPVNVMPPMRTESITVMDSSVPSVS